MLYIYIYIYITYVIHTHMLYTYTNICICTHICTHTHTHTSTYLQRTRIGILAHHIHHYRRVIKLLNQTVWQHIYFQKTLHSVLSLSVDKVNLKKQLKRKKYIEVARYSGSWKLILRYSHVNEISNCKSTFFDLA